MLLVGATQVMLDRLRDADVSFRRATSVARRSRRGAPLAWVLSGHAMVLYLLAEADRCVAVAEAAEEASRLSRQEGQVANAMVRRALALRLRGEPTAALQVTAEAQERLARSPLTIVTRTQRSHLVLIEWEDDPERLLRELALLAGDELELAEPGSSTSFALGAVRAALACGRVGEAERFASLARSRAAAHGLPSSEVRAACAEAELLLARGEAAAAARVAGAASSLARGAGHAARRARGRPARRPRAGGGGRARARGARPPCRGHRRRARRRAALPRRRPPRAAPARHPPPRRADPRRRRPRGAHRPRAEIATLVAAGRMNKQIAAALALSEKTIEANLSRIYAKVGVRSRAELRPPQSSVRTDRVRFGVRPRP